MCVCVLGACWACAGCQRVRLGSALSLGSHGGGGLEIQVLIPALSPICRVTLQPLPMPQFPHLKDESMKPVHLLGPSHLGAARREPKSYSHELTGSEAGGLAGRDNRALAVGWADRQSQALALLHPLPGAISWWLKHSRHGARQPTSHQLCDLGSL